MFNDQNQVFKIILSKQHLAANQMIRLHEIKFIFCFNHYSKTFEVKPAHVPKYYNLNSTIIAFKYKW